MMGSYTRPLVRSHFKAHTRGRVSVYDGRHCECSDDIANVVKSQAGDPRLGPTLMLIAHTNERT